MIINKDSLIISKAIVPMETSKKTHTDKFGKSFSYGLTECGYDIRLNQDIWMFYGKRFVLGSSYEYFNVPSNMMGRVLNKSSWARLGIDASRTTNLEPGWRGFLTLELTYSKMLPIFLAKGTGIAQIIFEEIKHPAQYTGKYQNQANKPVEAIT